MVPPRSPLLLQVSGEAVVRKMYNVNWLPLLVSKLREGTAGCFEMCVAAGRIMMPSFRSRTFLARPQSWGTNSSTLRHHWTVWINHIEGETSSVVWRKTLNDIWDSIGKSWHGSVSSFLKLVVSIHTCTLTSCDVFSLNWHCYWRRVKKAACRWYQPSWWMDLPTLLACIERAELGVRISFSPFHLFWI